MEDKSTIKQHRAAKSQEQEKSDQVKPGREDALKLDKQLQKEKYSRPTDPESLDDVTKLFTSMGVGEKWFPVGTTSAKFHPLFGTDEEKDGETVNVITTRLQCFTALKNYEKKSLEELRLDDYLAGHRYRGEPTGRFLFKKSKLKDADLNYEWTPTGTFEVGFEAVEDEEITKEGETKVESTILYHCITAMVEYEQKSFDELRLEDYLYRLPALKSLSAEMNGTALHEFKPYTMWESDHEVKHQFITGMPEYQRDSFEELRLTDYLSGRRGPRGPMYKASEEELMHLQVHQGMEVITFMKTGLAEVKEKGTIKYIGRLPDKAFGKFYVGLELDRPVGNGDGKISGIRLFQTRQNHAKIVPIEAVFPATLFDGFDDDDESMENQTEGGSSQNIEGFIESQKCVVCFSRNVEIFLSPCGHACCCEQCARMLSDCPICRRRISERKKVTLCGDEYVQND